MGEGNLGSSEFFWEAPGGAKAMGVAPGVFVPDWDPSLGVAEGPKLVVGDKTVKGWWNEDDQARGVPGTYGKG